MYRHLEYKNEDSIKFVNVWNAENIALNVNNTMINNSAEYMKDEIKKLFIDKNRNIKEGEGVAHE